MAMGFADCWNAYGFQMAGLFCLRIPHRLQEGILRGISIAARIPLSLGKIAGLCLIGCLQSCCFEELVEVQRQKRSDAVLEEGYDDSKQVCGMNQVVAPMYLRLSFVE